MAWFKIQKRIILWRLADGHRTFKRNAPENRQI